MKQVLKTAVAVTAFIGLISLGFHFGTLWGIFAIIVYYVVEMVYDWRKV